MGVLEIILGCIVAIEAHARLSQAILATLGWRSKRAFRRMTTPRIQDQEAGEVPAIAGWAQSSPWAQIAAAAVEFDRSGDSAKLVLAARVLARSMTAQERRSLLTSLPTINHDPSS